jgi:hypothetical protein
MNNFTFGDAAMGYYETIAGGAGAGPTWQGRDGVHTHMTNTRITGEAAPHTPLWAEVHGHVNACLASTLCSSAALCLPFQTLNAAIPAEYSDFSVPNDIA